MHSFEDIVNAYVNINKDLYEYYSKSSIALLIAEKQPVSLKSNNGIIDVDSAEKVIETIYYTKKLKKRSILNKKEVFKVILLLEYLYKLRSFHAQLNLYIKKLHNFNFEKIIDKDYLEILRITATSVDKIEDEHTIRHTKLPGIIYTLYQSLPKRPENCTIDIVLTNLFYFDIIQKKLKYERFKDNKAIVIKALF